MAGSHPGFSTITVDDVIQLTELFTTVYPELLYLLF